MGGLTLDKDCEHDEDREAEEDPVVGRTPGRLSEVGRSSEESVLEARKLLARLLLAHREECLVEYLGDVPSGSVLERGDDRRVEERVLCPVRVRLVVRHSRHVVGQIVQTALVDGPRPEGESKQGTSSGEAGARNSGSERAGLTLIRRLRCR